MGEFIYGILFASLHKKTTQFDKNNILFLVFFPQLHSICLLTLENPKDGVSCWSLGCSRPSILKTEKEKKIDLNICGCRYIHTCEQI